MTNSICIATYNGEKFIKEQLISILLQINDDDEIIIVDDCSTDKTIEQIINLGDKRIKLYENKKTLGVNKNFEIAITKATKDIIFLSDQDDVWVDGRMQSMVNKLVNTYALLVTGNSKYIDINGKEIEFKLPDIKEKNSYKFKGNIGRILIGTAGYYGCTMAFKKEFVNILLPFPNYIESHDLWIALTANIIKRNEHLNNIVLKRRIHGNNSSFKKTSIIEKIISRLIHLLSIVHICFRIKNNINQ